MMGQRISKPEVTRDISDYFDDDGRLEVVGVVPNDAFILPDEPMVRDPFRAAIIYPDEPIRSGDDETGVAVGMDGLTEHEVGSTGAAVLEPEQVAAVLDELAERLRKYGVAGLALGSRALPLDVMLKAYLREYFSNHY